jgi:AcrR family transcriptional regulator
MGDERERILRATVRLAASGGFQDLTATEIRRHAGVSRRGFNAHFASPTECFLESIEWLASIAADRGWSWAAIETDPYRRMSRMIVALTAQAARNELLAKLVLAGAVEIGREGLLCRERLISEAAAQTRAAIGPALAPPWTADASVAAVWHIATVEALTDKAKSLPRLAPLLVQLMLKTGQDRPHARR